jgi:Domain of unknown function (DUF5615)
MAAFYLDENVAVELALLLRQWGHSVTTTAEEHRLGAPDPHQLLHAAVRGWTFVTHNRHDFRLLHDAWHLWSSEWRVAQLHGGILIIEQMRWRSLTDLARIIHDFVSDSDVALANALFDWKPLTGWIRYRS